MGTYLTVADLKSYVRSELSVDDGWYDAAISTAEGIINNNTGRQFVVASPTVSTARSYMASDGELLMIPAQIVEACKIIAKDVFLQRDVAHGLIGVSDVGGIGTRENRVVVDAIAAYQHPQGIVVG